MAFDPEAHLSVLDILRIAPAEITLGKTEIMHGIEQVGFAGAVASADPHDPFRKPVLHRIVILKLEQRYGGEEEGQGNVEVKVMVKVKVKVKKRGL